MSESERRPNDSIWNLFYELLQRRPIFLSLLHST